MFHIDPEAPEWSVESMLEKVEAEKDSTGVPCLVVILTAVEVCKMSRPETGFCGCFDGVSMTPRFGTHTFAPKQLSAFQLL